MFTSPSSAGRSWTHKLLAAAARFQTEKSVAWQRQQNFCDDGWCLEPGLARRLLTHSYLEQRGENKADGQWTTIFFKGRKFTNLISTSPRQCQCSLLFISPSFLWLTCQLFPSTGIGPSWVICSDSCWWQAFSSQEFPGITSCAVSASQNYLALKDREIGALEVTGFHRLCFSLLYTLPRWRGTVFPNHFHQCEEQIRLR